MVLPITLVTAAAAAIINVWLAIRTSRVGITGKVMLGDGGDPAVTARMRAHANFVENAPFVLILIAGIEFARGPELVLWAIAAIFAAARVAHALGMERPAPSPLRAFGALATWIVLAVLAIWALVIVYQTERTPVPAPEFETITPSA